MRSITYNANDNKWNLWLSLPDISSNDIENLICICITDSEAKIILKTFEHQKEVISDGRRYYYFKNINIGY